MDHNIFENLKNHEGTLFEKNDNLLVRLKEIVDDIIIENHREDAMDILRRCSTKTIMEFLFFSASDNGNLTCMCLDFAKDEQGNKVSNQSFGNQIYD